VKVTSSFQCECCRHYFKSNCRKHENECFKKRELRRIQGEIRAIEIKENADRHDLRKFTALAYRSLDGMKFKEIGLRIGVGAQQARQIVDSGRRRFKYPISPSCHRQMLKMIELIQNL